jgi:hypothetical protein
LRRLALAALPLLAAALGTVLVARAGAARPVTAFRTPNAAAACRLERTTLVCSSLGSPGSVALQAGKDARVVSRLPWWDASTPVVRTWSRSGITCQLAAGDALLCRAGAGSLRVAASGFAVAG